MKQELYIGLMSGTSADGIDASLIQMQASQVCSVEQVYLAFEPQFKQKVLSLYQSQQEEIETLGEVSVELANLYADAIHLLLNKAAVHSSQITAIGCHGQTIRHRPNLNTPFTLQICDYARLAELTQIDVIGDFRSADIAAGGQGAPLVPAFHKAIFPAQGKDQVVLNIGGIANISILKPDGQILGFDTGPGNGLMDEWCELHTSHAFDRNGEWAATGQAISELLEDLLENEYFVRQGPKSSGREVFNLAFLKPYLKSEYKAKDVQATLLSLTAESIRSSIVKHSSCADVWVCGGGVHNQALMLEIVKRLGENYSVQSSQSIKIAPDWIEADCFAWLAYCFNNRIPANIPQVTGATKSKILGCLYPFS